MARTKTVASPKKTAPGTTGPAPISMPVAARPNPRRLAVKQTKAPVAPAPAAIPAPPVQPETGSKLTRIITLLRRPEGATIAELMQLTSWLPHSVRGALSGALKRKMGLAVESRVDPDRGRVYRIAAPTKATPPVSTATSSAPHPAKSGRVKHKPGTTGATA